MFKTENIEKLVKYSIITGWLKREIAPISLMLIAPPESNKTSILKSFETVKNICYTVDISAKPLIEFLKQAKNDKFMHLIVPDFIKIVSHNQNVSRTVVAMLNAMIEEGIRKSMFYGQEIDLGKNIKCGLITSITPNLYKQQFKAWNDIGFLSRFLPVTYEYSEETRNSIMKLISGNGMESLDETVAKIRKSGPKTVRMKPDIAAAIRLYTEDIVKRLREFRVTITRGTASYKITMDIQGFRLLKQLMLLSKAIAFSKGLDEVNYTCLEELKELLEYINAPNSPKEI